MARSAVLALLLLAVLAGISCQSVGYGVRPSAGEAMPAFDGAEGFGRNATGWRGGAVIKVTNLNDGGPGSLRACADGSRPRVCVFEVAGTIEADSTIEVGSNVYLAGQTAPGNGVQLRLRRSPDRPMMVRAARDVVIRHRRLRPGPSRESSSNVDAIGIFDSRDVILDHLSLQWATDELLDIATLCGSTFKHYGPGQPARLGARFRQPPQGKHSKGALICAMDGRGGCGRISMVRNLFAHNRDRNPDVNGTSIGPVEIVNNVFYNPRSEFGEFYDNEGDLRINYIGNAALSGPSTRRSPPYAVDIRNHYSPTFEAMVYVRDNINGNHRPRLSGPEELVVRPQGRHYLAPKPFAPLTVQALSPDAALERVLVSAGATAPRRDRLDQQVVREVMARAGRVIDDPAEVGGWPALRSGPVLADGDGDGMPDEWEVAHGSDPRTFDAWQDADGNGWSDLEDYLNQTADRPAQPLG